MARGTPGTVGSKGGGNVVPSTGPDFTALSALGTSASIPNVGIPTRGRIYEEKLPPPGIGTIPDFPQRRFPPFNRPQPRPPIRPQRPPFISRPSPIRPMPRPSMGSGASNFYRRPSYSYGVPTGLGSLLSGQQSPFGRMVDPATGFPQRSFPRPVMGRPDFGQIGRSTSSGKSGSKGGAKTVTPEPKDIPISDNRINLDSFRELNPQIETGEGFIPTPPSRGGGVNTRPPVDEASKLKQMESQRRFTGSDLPSGATPLPAKPPPSSAPVFDDTAILERLSALEGRTPAPAFDPTGLQSRLTALEERRATPAAPRFDDSALQQRLTALEARPTITPSRFDDSALRQRLTALEARPTMTASRFDDSALQQRLTALESRRIPTFDPSGLQQRLRALEGRTSPTFDPRGLQSQITALQNRPTVSAFDPSGLQRQIDALSSRPAPTAFDPSSLQSQISALNTRLDTAASSAGSKGGGMNVNPSMRAPSLGSVGTVVTPTGITNNRMATPRNLRRMGR